MNFAEDIKELILLNEVVVLPGFGGFISRYHPAAIRRDSRRMDPPSKEILFDERMTAGSGLFAAYVAKKHNLLEEEAQNMVSGYIDTLISQFEQKGMVSLEGIGRIFRNAAGGVSFEQTSDENYLVQSFGLPRVEIPSPGRASDVSVRPVQSSPAPKTVVPERILRPERKKVPLAVIIAGIVLLAAGGIYFSGLFDRFLKPLFVPPELVSITGEPEGKIVFGKSVAVEGDSLQLEVNRQLEEKAEKENALIYQEKKQPETDPAIHVPDVKPEPPVTVPVEHPEPVVVSPPAGAEEHYHVVAGSFTVEENAIRQKTRLENMGFTPRIVQKRGKYFYVSLQSFPTEAAAKAEMQRIHREHGLALWVMYR